MADALSLTGGTVLTANGTTLGDVHVAGGTIVEQPATDARRINCTGYHVLPGIVDVHGDAFEVELFPRPGVEIDFDIAMRSVDRQLTTNGITTAFHALTISWEPGARSLPAARRFIKRLDRLRPRLMADHRVQLRWEVFAHDAIADVAGWLAQDPTPAIAFNDHTTETLSTIAGGDTGKLRKWAARAGVTLDAYSAAADTVRGSGPLVSERISEAAALARDSGAVQLAHDETSLRDRATHRALGMHVSEFPLSPDVAREAVARGEHVVMGAPNVLRGTSHKGYLSAGDAVERGFCTVLASDYYYPGLLHAAEKITRRGMPLAKAWALVSANPAQAMRLPDRGTIRPGQRGDLLVVDCTDDWRLVHCISGGAVTSLGA